jgi:hypothetical protein
MINKDVYTIILIAVIVNVIMNTMFRKHCFHHYYIINDSEIDLKNDISVSTENNLNNVPIYTTPLPFAEKTMSRPLKTIISPKVSAIGGGLQLYPSLPCPKKTSTVQPTSYISNFANNNIDKMSIDALFEGCSLNEATMVADYCSNPFNYALQPDLCFSALKNYEIAQKEYKRNGSDLYAENCEKTQFLGKNGFLPK